MMMFLLIGATSAPAVAGGESSLLFECAVASTILIVLLSLWGRKTLAFWCWGFYSPLRRTRATTAILFGARGP